MKSEIQSTLELFAENVYTIEREKKLQWDDAHRMAALLYAQENKQVDGDSIRACLDLIKANTGLFSVFKGNVSLATLLSLSEGPEALFENVVTVYDLLKGAKFSASEFLAMAAYMIAVQAEPENYQNIVERTRAFYDGMKASHRFLTGQDDYIHAAMLGLSGLDVTAGVERMEQLYQQLKEEFKGFDSIQALAQVLTLVDCDEQTISRLLALRDEMKARKTRLDKGYTLQILGLLAALPVDAATLVSEIAEAHEYLRKQKGLGDFSTDAEERLTYAASVVARGYVTDIRDGVLTAALSTSILNILIEQQVVMMMLIAYVATGAVTAAMATAGD